ncbi:MAG: efflux RND transporter periplasmic adaptor subunit [Muribaculaceae bacterium]|nr:efflux RND transporter periplasmic adaptor subunit [Muribaculaceae bacterium]
MGDFKAGSEGAISRTGHKGGFPRWIFLLIGVLVVVALSVWLLLPRQSVGGAPLPEVKVAVVDTVRVEVYEEYEGSIRASQSVEVTARVEGVLEKMLFKEGCYVNKGQTLFVIDPKLYQAQVDRARAQLDRAKALKNKADRDLNRIRPLYTQKAASQLDLDNAEAAVECAEADVEIARVDLLEAQVTLGYTRVVAPISGFISERMVDVGALVGPGGKSLLATIVRSDTVLVDFSMTSLEYFKSKDRDVNIRCDDDGECLDRLPSYVTITLADGSAYPYRGIVDFADPVVDTKSGTISVRAEMPNPDGCLLPGEKTKVNVLLDVLEDTMTVPAVAVQRGKDGNFVYVVSSEGRVEKRRVSLGDTVGKLTVVKGGLSVGEMVALDRFDILSDSSEVIPVGIHTGDNSKKAARPLEGSK